MWERHTRWSSLLLGWILTSLAGCQRTESPPPPPAQATQAASALSASAPKLHGLLPSQRLPAPEFSARNRDGGARTRADLIGHPTVMWFYPKASTPG
jgi:hypothetical protein